MNNRAFTHETMLEMEDGTVGDNYSQVTCYKTMMVPERAHKQLWYNITDNSSLSYSLYSWLSVCYSSEHQELAKQIQEQTDPAHPQATSGLERQLELLVEHLETKAEQIKIVRKQLLTRRQRSRSRSRLHQATASLPVARDGEVEVTTTVKAKGSPQRQAYSTVDCKTPSLEFLKKMKSLQNTLQRDDLSWD